MVDILTIDSGGLDLASGKTYDINGSPHQHTTLYDANGLEGLKIVATASAVNEISITNAATGSSPIIEPTGDDANLGITMRCKADASPVSISSGSAYNLGARIFMCGRDHATLPGCQILDFGGYDATGYFTIRHRNTAGATSIKFYADGTGISFFTSVTVAQQAHIANPSGGATTDAEARTAINSILTALENYGLLAAA
jgi:hypothetical protein